MKRFFQILTVALLGAGLVACESMKLGEAGLSKAPETSGATIDTLFATVKDADKVLAQAYYYLPYGLVTAFDSKMGSDFLEAITDHYVSNKHSDGDGPNNLYYTGALNANLTSGTGGETYRFGSEKDYTVIRYAWLFLENADRIPNADAGLLAEEGGSQGVHGHCLCPHAPVRGRCSHPGPRRADGRGDEVPPQHLCGNRGLHCEAV